MTLLNQLARHGSTPLDVVAHLALHATAKRAQKKDRAQIQNVEMLRALAVNPALPVTNVTRLDFVAVNARARYGAERAAQRQDLRHTLTENPCDAQAIVDLLWNYDANVMACHVMRRRDLTASQALSVLNARGRDVNAWVGALRHVEDPADILVHAAIAMNKTMGEVAEAALSAATTCEGQDAAAVHLALTARGNSRDAWDLFRLRPALLAELDPEHTPEVDTFDATTATVAELEQRIANDPDPDDVIVRTALALHPTSRRALEAILARPFLPADVRDAATWAALSLDPSNKLSPATMRTIASGILSAPLPVAVAYAARVTHWDHANELLGRMDLPTATLRDLATKFAAHVRKKGVKVGAAAVLIRWALTFALHPSADTHTRTEAATLTAGLRVDERTTRDVAWFLALPTIATTATPAALGEHLTTKALADRAWDLPTVVWHILDAALSEHLANIPPRSAEVLVALAENTPSLSVSALLTGTSAVLS